MSDHPKELTWINGQLARKCACRDCKPRGFELAIAGFCFGVIALAALLVFAWDALR